MTTATARSPRTRALLRAVSGAVLAIAAVAVAVLAPGMFTEADGETPGVWARGTSVAAALVLLVVVLANVVGLRDGDRDRMRSLAMVAALGGVATLLAIVVGAFLLSIDGSRAVVGVGVILALLPLLAIALAVQTRHLDA